MNLNKALDDLYVFKIEQGLDFCVSIDRAIWQQKKPDNDSRKMLYDAWLDVLQQEKNRRAELKKEFDEFIKPQI